MNNCFIILAAGKSNRFKSKIPKPFVQYNGDILIKHSINKAILSKYFSTAKEKRKRENAEISIEGIRVNNEKKAIYFLLALDPSTTISLFIEFLTSKKINRKNMINKTMLDNKRYCKF